MKYGSLRPLLTSSHADITLLVKGLGPQLNTPILLTYNSKIAKRSFKLTHAKTYVTVSFLHKFEERGHVRSPEVINSFQSGKNGSFRKSLEMVLANVQHRRSQIELVEKLRDEDVDLEDVRHIFLLDVAQHVDEPLEVLVRGTYPQEIHLKSNKITPNLAGCGFVLSCTPPPNICWSKYRKLSRSESRRTASLRFRRRP
jgi:hypothetical protein